MTFPTELERLLKDFETEPNSIRKFNIDQQIDALLRNHADAILGLVRAAEVMSRALDTGHRNNDGTQMGVRMPERAHVDSLAEALTKLKEGK